MTKSYDHTSKSAQSSGRAMCIEGKFKKYTNEETELLKPRRFGRKAMNAIKTSSKRVGALDATQGDQN